MSENKYYSLPLMCVFLIFGSYMYTRFILKNFYFNSDWENRVSPHLTQLIHYPINEFVLVAS